ncbi:WD40 repeat domain-containing serine/threonine protein kinase [Nonomuraea angiospora]|uniref:WD40 repeat domain-containing serine/threonine protein kinase n=1 Tax=Nonomuraea angiospora TaxID=46172 RepID=UPI00332E57C2
MSVGPVHLLADRYQLQGALGRGGMGTVWQAWDTELDRAVAIKELRLSDDIPEEERRNWYARMEREARAAARLKHPGIVTIYDRVIEEDGRPWIVMELIHGSSLDDLLRRHGRLPAERVAAIGLQMLDALIAAHATGIVHRDVKPANVLLEGDRVVLTDFGISTLEGDAPLTRSGALLGTPSFMSPEQVHGGPATAQSDLWSLGATLYTAVEGHPPFSGTTPGSVFVAIATERPDPTHHAGPLVAVLDGLLCKDPTVRLTAQATRDKLTHLAAAQETPQPTFGRSSKTGTGPPPSGVPQRRGPRTLRTLPALGLIVTLVGISAALTIWLQSPPSPVQNRFPRLAWLSESEADWGSGLALSPDGTTLAVGTRTGVEFWDVATRRKLGDTVEISGAHRVDELVYSPDGKKLAVLNYGLGGRQLHLWDAVGRKPDGPALMSGGEILGVAFSPDGRTISATSTERSWTELWAVASRRPVGTPVKTEPLAVSITFLDPGGKLFVSDGPEVWDAATGRKHRRQFPITPCSNSGSPSALAPDGQTMVMMSFQERQLCFYSTKTYTQIGLTREVPEEAKMGPVAFSRDGAILASGGKTVRLWNTRTFEQIGPDMTPVETKVVSRDGDRVAITPDGNVLISLTSAGVEFWDISSAR